MRHNMTSIEDVETREQGTVLSVYHGESGTEIGFVPLSALSDANNARQLIADFAVRVLNRGYRAGAKAGRDELARELRQLIKAEREL